MVMLEDGTTPRILSSDEFLHLEESKHTTGQHKLYLGPTQCGKTSLARVEARLARAVVVLGTKNKDSSLDAYVQEGYQRIYAWPPTKKEVEKSRTPSGSIRLILWPKFTDLNSLTDPKARDQFLKMFAQAYKEGFWTIVCDESLWLAARDGLKLDSTLSKMAYASASNKVSLYLLMQRPAGISRTTWSSASDAFIFHCGVTNDLRELASLGTYSPKDAREVIQNLTGHQFLKMPIRSGEQWVISELDRATLAPRKLP